MSSIKGASEYIPLIPKDSQNSNRGSLAHHDVEVISSGKTAPKTFSTFAEIAEKVAIAGLSRIGLIALNIVVGVAWTLKSVYDFHTFNFSQANVSGQKAFVALINLYQSIIDPTSVNSWPFTFGQTPEDIHHQTDGSNTTLSQDHKVGQHLVRESICFKKKDWVDCNYTRRFYQESDNFNQYASNLESKIPNLAVHEVRVNTEGRNEKIFSCVRSGGITDARYGAYSLKDLKAIKNSPSRSYDHIESKIVELKESVQKDPKAVEYLEASQNQLRRLDNPLIDLYQERIDRLKPQFFQLLGSHLQNSDVSLLQNGSLFTLSEMGLIHTNPKMEKEGILHDEKVIREDTQEMLSLFNGSEIVFSDDVKEISSSVDNKKIFVPRSIVANLPLETQTLNLKSFYFNISIQKDLQNSEDQKAINREAFLALENGHTVPAALKEAYDSLKNIILTKEKLSYKEVLQMQYLLHKMGISSGIMCFSGKDRTGKIVADLARIITEHRLGASSSTMGSINSGSLAVSVADYNAINPYVKDAETNEESVSVVYIPQKITFLKLGSDIQDSFSKKCEQILHVALGHLKGTNIAD